MKLFRSTSGSGAPLRRKEILGNPSRVDAQRGVTSTTRLRITYIEKFAATPGGTKTAALEETAQAVLMRAESATAAQRRTLLHCPPNVHRCATIFRDAIFISRKSRVPNLRGIFLVFGQGMEPKAKQKNFPVNVLKSAQNELIDNPRTPVRRGGACAIIGNLVGLSNGPHDRYLESLMAAFDEDCQDRVHSHLLFDASWTASDF